MKRTVTNEIRYIENHFKFYAALLKTHSKTLKTLEIVRKKHHELINDGGPDKSGFSGYSEDDTDSENSSFVGKSIFDTARQINFPETKPENYQVPILSRTRVSTSWTPPFFTLSLNQEIRQGEVLSFWRFTSKLF